MSKLFVACCLIAFAGAVSSRRIARIAGGNDAKPGEAPYYVSLFARHVIPEIDPEAICGGAILNEQWIVTSAYCVYVYGEDVTKLFIKAGNVVLYEPSETEQVSDVVLAIGHPKYQDELDPCDIGVLKLKTPLRFNKFVSPIVLPVPESTPSGSGTVAGIGSLHSMVNPVFPEVLQIISLPFISNEECKKKVDNQLGELAESLVLVDEWRICTGATESNVGVCVGDNGSPLIVKENGKDVLVGVTTPGLTTECTTPGLPSIYTKVSRFNKWIEESIKSN